jgi:hypothetical protein
MIIDEVQRFARDFINVKAFRTSRRRAKIREAYTLLTGEKIKVSCSTCYIEALLLIVNSKPMATQNYALKKGYTLLEIFGEPSKTCTNDTITDEIGDWVMQHRPELIVYFERVRGKPTAPVVPKEITIVEPFNPDAMVEDVLKPKTRKAKK